MEDIANKLFMTFGSTYHFIYFYQGCIHFGTSASLRKLCGRKDYSRNFRRLAYAPNLMHELIRLGNYPGGTQYFNGKLDEIRIFNRALSPGEIKKLFNYKRK